MDRSHLLIIGGGLAGLAAGIRAIQLGMRATVLERDIDKAYACATRLSGGVFHAAFQSVDAPVAQIEQAIFSSTEGFVDLSLARAIASNAGRSVAWLESEGVSFECLDKAVPWKDRTLAPLGYHDHPNLIWRGYGADAALNLLEHRFQSIGGQFLRGHRARNLVIEDNCCVGADVEVANGIERYAADGILLADGGFHGNLDMLRQYVTVNLKQLKLRGPTSGHGDGIKMASECGARLIGMRYFYGHLLSASSLDGDLLCPFPVLDMVAGAGVLVDSGGERFVDESKGGVKGGVYMANALSRHKDGLGIVICDHAIWETTGREFFLPPNPNIQAVGGKVIKSHSLASLADNLRLPVASFVKTISQYNEALAKSELGSLNPPRTDIDNAQPIQAAPFYGIPVCAAITHTMGGIAVNDRAQVVKNDGTVLAGVYAAGSTCGGLEGGSSCGYVGGLIKALVFGLLAAETSAHITAR